MKEQLARSFCHLFIRGHINYWAHDAKVDSWPKAQQFICPAQEGIYCSDSRGREVGGQRDKRETEEMIQGQKREIRKRVHPHRDSARETC